MNLIDRLRRTRQGFLTFAFLSNLTVATLGGGFLCWVAQNSGPTYGTVTIHVTEPDVVVSVGGQSFRDVGFTRDPFVCELRAGRHELTMKRGETLLHSETFTLAGGEDRVLTAWRSLGNPVR